jgi:hypothetical protein
MANKTDDPVSRADQVGRHCRAHAAKTDEAHL